MNNGKDTLVEMNDQNSVLLIIDVQEKLLKIMDRNVTPITIKNINLANLMSQKMKVPVMVSEQYVKGLGSTIPEIAKHLKGIMLHEKMTFSCHDHKELMHEMHDHNKKFVVLCGMEAHICVFHTAQDLLKQGFQVIVLSDAVQSSSEHKREWALNTISKCGAWVIPTETYIFQLMKRCDSETFKHWVQTYKSV